MCHLTRLTTPILANELRQYRNPSKGPVRHIAIDSTGLKVFGEGEWKVRKHGYEKRRTWRKIHLAVDIDTHLNPIML